MANEITVSGGMQIKIGYLNAAVSTGNYKVDQTNVAAVINTVEVSNAAWSQLEMGDIDVIGYAYMRNLTDTTSPTEYIEIAIKKDSTYYPFAKMYSGETFLGRLATETMSNVYATASNSATLLYWILND